jgi:hypothetical protein
MKKRVWSSGKNHSRFFRGAQKRGQFFLLAAVVIAVVVVSLGATTNRAVVGDEPDSFYDFSYEVKREAGEVLDYEIYSNIEGGSLDEFVQLLASEIRDRDPNANFMFIYGDNTEMNLRNYGKAEAFAGGASIPGASESAISTICTGGHCQDVDEVISDFDEGAGYVQLGANELSGDDDIVVRVGGQDFSFPISEHRQVVFVMQKGVNDESFVSVK